MELSNQNLKAVMVLVKAADAIHAVIKKDAAAHGLNPTEFSALELLYHQGRQPIQIIGKKVLINSSSITYVIDKLEKKKLVVRVDCPEDRRVTYAELTDEGRTLMARIFPEHEETINRVFGGLNEAETKAMIDSLKKIGYQAQEV
ncbi:MarR family winged helix-turn-helix transcriptional regulator [Planococcus salinus]|uniref:MarR family transcriptional regulator n=1 Tax=Planococcus salinus TaxID=1848460 RepID=A0A3M8PC56_9BACL|nr:MarR family transcriptional regulator [Planococcus salinus]RNF41202.1 MarR family transcriptional regulator [Planococcus salinus]